MTLSLKQVIERTRTLRQDKKTLRLLELIWKTPGIARKDLGAAARLSRGTVTVNIAQLMEEGLVREGEVLNEPANRLGRSSSGLYVADDFFYSIGISMSDVLTGCLFDASGTCVKKIQCSLSPDGVTDFKRTCDRLLETIDNLLKCVPEGKVAAMGIALVGIVDYDTGEVLSSSVFDRVSWFNLKNFIREHCGMECFLINVSHLRPVLEKLWGGAAEMEHFMTLDDSGAAGFYLNGQLFRGWQKHAGELSFMKITETQEYSSDGRNGLVELLAPFYLLRNRLKSMIANGGRPKILELMTSPDEFITPELVVRAIREGDRFLEQQMAERYAVFGDALVNTAYLLNPEAVFLEEWTSRCPQCTVDIVSRKMGSYGMSHWHLKTRILSAKCSKDMLPRGAAHLALESLFRDAAPVSPDQDSFNE